MSELKKSSGYQYLAATKFNRENIAVNQQLRIAPTGTFKSYPQAPVVQLPAIADPDPQDIWAALAARRSVRKYSDRPVSLEDLAKLLWSAQGVTASAGDHLFRTAPSAGALYPVETYISVQNVAGLEPGLFHFNVAEFSLERLTGGSVGGLVAAAALNQQFLARAGVVFIWSAVLRRNMSKYKHRGMRYIFMDAGHICQNLLLAAASMGYSACPVAAFFDDAMNDLLDLDGEEESVVYLASVGQMQ